MRTLDEISDDYWKVDAEYEDYTEVLHYRKLEEFRQRLHTLFKEFHDVKNATQSQVELVDSNPYALYGFNKYRKYR